MKRLFGIFSIILLLICLSSCAKSAENRWQEQYDLGIRYLSDGNYEEAVIAFTAAIEIDPKNADTYLNLAEAYIGLNDYESAKQVIENGYDITEKESLKEALDTLYKEHTSLLIGDDPIEINDLKINGKEISACTLEDVIVTYPQDNEEDSWWDSIGTPIFESYSGGIQYSPRSKLPGGGNAQIISATAWSYTSEILHFDYSAIGLKETEIINFPDLRSINIGDSFEEVLYKMNFKAEGIDYLRDIQGISFTINDIGEWSYTVENVYGEDGKIINIFDEGKTDSYFLFDFWNDRLVKFTYGRLNS